MSACKSICMPLKCLLLDAVDEEIARSLLFLTPLSATRQSPVNDSGTSGRMAASPREPGLSREQRRALPLLANTPYGAIEDLLVHAYEFARDMMAGLADEAFAPPRGE